MNLSVYIAQAGLEFLILLPQPHEYLGCLCREAWLLTLFYRLTSIIYFNYVQVCESLSVCTGV